MYFIRFLGALRKRLRILFQKVQSVVMLAPCFRFSEPSRKEKERDKLKHNYHLFNPFHRFVDINHTSNPTISKSEFQRNCGDFPFFNLCSAARCDSRCICACICLSVHAFGRQFLVEEFTGKFQELNSRGWSRRRSIFVFLFNCWFCLCWLSECVICCLLAEFRFLWVLWK